MEERFMIHYAEVGLKGKNRAFFEKRLVQNVKQSLRGTGYAAVKRLHDRIQVQLAPHADIAEIKKRLSRVMGIAHFELVCCSEKDMEAIKATALQQTADKTFQTLKIETNVRIKPFR